MRSAIAKLLGFGGKARSVAPDARRLRGKFDAAQTSPDDRRHWANADHLAADAACNPQIRAILRSRGRYEQFNNPYTDGQLQTLAADVVGRGPRLRLLLEDSDASSFVENEFGEWCRRTNFTEKLLTAVECRAAAGECFFIRQRNLGLPTAVKLDLKLIEGDQVAAPNYGMQPLDVLFDGIEYDRYGNPSVYHVLRHHPGSLAPFEPGPIADPVPASEVIHFFKSRRPGQQRGIPQITSSLPLYAERRRFRKAVVSAAQKIASMGAVSIESAGIADSADQPVPFDEIELIDGMGTVLPAGWTSKQVKPEQPGTNYKDFDDKLIGEGARPLSMPFNVAACNSSSYNYASGRLDHQTYDRNIDVDHLMIETRILDVVLGWWLDEAKRILGYLPAAVLQAIASRPKYQWLWRGRPHVDPVAEADAEAKRLASRTLSMTDALAQDGTDLEAHAQTLSRDADVLARAGLEYKTPLVGPQLLGALEVLKALGRGEIAAVAAVELLIGLGVPRQTAINMAAKQPAVTTPAPKASAAPTDGTPTDAQTAAAAEERRKLMGLNGTTNGVHHA